jgi:hypothetical protein
MANNKKIFTYTGQSSNSNLSIAFSNPNAASMAFKQKK